MTNYQILIDAITNEIYQLYTTTNGWNEEKAKATSHNILELVEQFKQKQTVNV